VDCKSPKFVTLYAPEYTQMFKCFSIGFDHVYWRCNIFNLQNCILVTLY